MSELVPLATRYSEREIARRDWIERVRELVRDRDLLFFDPDNGIAPSSYRATRKASVKSVHPDELAYFRRPNRTIVVYHHHSRFKGGHEAELRFYANRLRDSGFQRVDALRAKPFSPRIFYIVDADDEIAERAKRFASKWSDGDLSYVAN